LNQQHKSQTVLIGRLAKTDLIQPTDIRARGIKKNGRHASVHRPFCFSDQPDQDDGYWKGLFGRVLICLTLVLASRPALLELLFQRAEGLICGAANRADQSDAVLDKRVEILVHEPVLQFHIGARVRKLEQFLRGPQISAGYSLDETGHALLQILKAARRGAGEHHERADILGCALDSLHDLAAKPFELLGCVLNNLLLAVGQVLPHPAETLAPYPAAAIHGLSARLADPVCGVGGEFTFTLNGIAGCTSTGLDCLSGLASGILLRIINHVFLL
jgi:hypothetical protein